MGRLSGTEISSSPGLKNPQNLAHGQKILPSQEIFIPDNHGPFGNCIPVRVNQAILYFNLTSF